MTRTKKLAIGAAVAILALLVVYLVGYWPERQRRLGVEREVADLRARVDALEEEVRAARLFGDLLHITDAAAAMNYGVARDLSTQFFDTLGADAERTTDGRLRSALQELAARRDAVTGALAVGDPRVVDMLRQMEVEYRDGLGYPTGFRPAPAPAQAPAR